MAAKKRYNRETGEFEYYDDTPGPIDQGAVDQYYQEQTGGTEQQAADFLNANPGDDERLYQDNVFANVPGVPDVPTPEPPTTPPLPARPRPSGGGGGGGNAGGGGGSPFPWAGHPAFAPDSRYSSPLLDQLLKLMVDNQTALAEQRRSEQEGNQRFRASVRGNVLNTMERASRYPTLQDPSIAPRVQAFGAEAERGSRMAQERIAARRGVKGITQGAADAGVEGTIQNLAQSRGAFNANVLAEGLRENRAELMNAMNLGAGILGDQESRDLREQLAGIDAELSRLGLQTGAFTTTRGQDITGSLGSRGLDIQERGLDQSNQQFYDNLAYQASIQEALLNQALMQQLLGGSV